MTTKVISAPKSPLDLEEKLILLVQQRPALYDKKDHAYKNRNTRALMWEEIGKILLKTETECQQLWTKLRSQFSGFLRKLRNPSGMEDKPRPFFRHEGSMRFIRDTVDPDESTVSNLVNEDDSSFVEMCGPGSEIQIEVVDVDKLPDDFDPLSTEKRKLDAFDKEMLDLLKSNDDEHDSFGKMLAPKLRRIAELDRKVFLNLQRKINDAVLDAEIEILA
ncbi:Transcription factor Adf-1 [Folsomia candida]|uniref:Transcription factor Adf-1 n=1 Tax=Folsomia candida TaxID=158441 RepID=A0A226EW63_FOLCA|nr:Transcription factor Adf-1 [Folsomia candida]